MYTAAKAKFKIFFAFSNSFQVFNLPINVAFIQQKPSLKLLFRPTSAFSIYFNIAMILFSLTTAQTLASSIFKQRKRLFHSPALCPIHILNLHKL